MFGWIFYSKIDFIISCVILSFIRPEYGFEGSLFDFFSVRVMEFSFWIQEGIWIKFLSAI